MKLRVRPLCGFALILAWASPAAAEEGRRMLEELRALVHEDAKSIPRDPRLEDLTPEERDAIVPAREVDETPPPPKRPKPPPSADSPVVMDPMIIEGQADPALRLQLQELAHVSAMEEKATEPTLLDQILNHPRISILGGYNAHTRAAMARYRIRIMDAERMLLIAIAAAETEAEKAELKAYLWELREMRRWIGGTPH